MFQPIAVETLGRINESAVQLLDDLGHGITSVSADDKEGQFLFQRLPIALQRFNAILLHMSFDNDEDPTNYCVVVLKCLALSTTLILAN